jgi:hypothetical protein
MNDYSNPHKQVRELTNTDKQYTAVLSSEGTKKDTNKQANSPLVLGIFLS